MDVKVSEDKNISRWGPQTTLHMMTPLSARPGLGTQPYYEVPCDLQVKHKQNTVINIMWVRLFPQ